MLESEEYRGLFYGGGLASVEAASRFRVEIGSS